jgi:cytidylate kinase
MTNWLKITLGEGRKRQVRRMMALLGHPVVRLIRVGLGPLDLGDLRPGKWRDLTPGEVSALHALAGRGAADAVADPARERMNRPVTPVTIAIDGPSASGKSTVGALLADQLGYLFFDTGIMYRAVAAVALARSIDPEDEPGVTQLAEALRIDVVAATVADGRDVTVLADGEDITWAIRRREVEKAVSPGSSFVGVRRALTQQQRRIGGQGRVVMVGRDIGTVVLPNADLKVYLDATLAERGHRRFLERQRRGESVDEAQVLAEVKRRDAYDSSRQHAPLAAAADAIVIDSTHLSVEEVLARARTLIERWGGRG